MKFPIHLHKHVEQFLGVSWWKYAMHSKWIAGKTDFVSGKLQARVNTDRAVENIIVQEERTVSVRSDRPRRATDLRMQRVQKETGMA